VQNLKILAALITTLIPAPAHGQAAHSSRPPSKRASAQSGKELFSEYCASCHGVSGKGDGPAASALRISPADLTALAARNKGQFPSLRVMQAIKAGPSVPAHGSKIMPVWGPIFLGGDPMDNPGQTPPQTPAGVAEESGRPGRHGATAAEAQLRIYNLMEYIRTLQLK
jgi:cytochrome c553